MSSSERSHENNNLTLDLINQLKELSDEYFEFHSSIVPVTQGAPTSIEFLRNWVSHNTPVIFKNAIKHWPAMTKWNNEYLSYKLKDQKITVSITPTGYADSVSGDEFLLPEEKQIHFDDFLSALLCPKSSVYYVQKQNNNLMDEFSSLLPDVDHHIPWASDALGKKPDAVNFWMGDERAVTSLHKDHYENIYCVVKGRKEFILHAPVDAAWIPYENFRVAMYSDVDEACRRIDMHQEVQWIPVDPLHPVSEKDPFYPNARRIRCVVEEGDVLYLPSLWFHHVRQSHACIAINYWYDMDFDAKYCHFKHLEKLGRLIRNNSVQK